MAQVTYSSNPASRFRGLVPTAVLGAASASSLLMLWMALRRMFASLPAPSHLTVLVGGVSLAVLGVAMHWALHRCSAPVRRLRLARSLPVAFLLPASFVLLGLIALSAELSLPLLASWAICAASMSLVWRWLPAVEIQAPPPNFIAATTNADPAATSELESEAEVDVTNAWPADATQSLLRRQTDQGEQVSAKLRVATAAWETRALLHVPFCPPFSAAPQVTATLVSGPPASVNIELAETYGARLRVELEEADEEPRELVVELLAVG